MQALAQGQGVVVSYYPSGPLLEYMPDKVKRVPTTAEELLAWTRENKNRFLYARPANSGPGRTFIMGLPYILGDSNPKDPMRSEEHTSELQSRQYLVCRLLLEKKKNTKHRAISCVDMSALW